ncbi:MAG: hypothetical protein ACJ74G_16165 [Blastocatellia bacterium]
MSKRVSKRLVIDASVARSSGDENAVFPTSKRCRDFLLATLDICHQAVMTEAIRDEWNRHQSRFARGWRVSMVARRKLHIIDVALDDHLRERIRRVATRTQDRETMLKDAHLLEAAIATDQVVISLDETVRVLFVTAAIRVGEIRRILWANPDKIEEDCVSWLERGARSERRRQLGFVE